MKNNAYWQKMVPGISDEEFLRGEVPMTKEEVRVVTLSKAKIFPEAIVYDIGAGTGSLSIEAALLAKEGQVWALERNPSGVELIKENTRKFQINNLNVLTTVAPLGIKELPPADVILIGGSGGNLFEILQECLDKLKNGGRMVVNAITHETLNRTLAFAQEYGLDYQVVTVSASRLERIKDIHMWKAINPVQIITLIRKEKESSNEG